MSNIVIDPSAAKNSGYCNEVGNFNSLFPLAASLQHTTQVEPKLQSNLQELASSKQDNVACFKTGAAL